MRVGYCVNPASLGPTSTQQLGTERPSLHKYSLSMDSAQALDGFSVYKTKKTDPEPAPRELTVSGGGRYSPGNYSSGCTVL